MTIPFWGLKTSGSKNKCKDKCGFFAALRMTARTYNCKGDGNDQGNGVVTERGCYIPPIAKCAMDGVAGDMCSSKETSGCALVKETSDCKMRGQRTLRL